MYITLPVTRAIWTTMAAPSAKRCFWASVRACGGVPRQYLGARVPRRSHVVHGTVAVLAAGGAVVARRVVETRRVPRPTRLRYGEGCRHERRRPDALIAAAPSTGLQPQAARHLDNARVFRAAARARKAADPLAAGWAGGQRQGVAQRRRETAATSGAVTRWRRRSSGSAGWLGSITLYAFMQQCGCRTITLATLHEPLSTRLQLRTIHSPRHPGGGGAQ